MSEPGNGEGLPPPDENGQLPPETPEESTEGSDELSYGARQTEAARLAQEGNYEAALRMMVPDLDLLQQPVEGEEVPRVLQPEAEARLVELFSPLGRAAAVANLALLNIDQEQVERILQRIPEATEEESPDVVPTEAQRDAEADGLLSMIEDAQDQARHAENDPLFTEMDETDASRTKSAIALMKQKLANAKGSLDHMTHAIQHWMQAPPKEWAGRGYRFVTTSMIWFFLFVVWELKAIGATAKKK